MEHPSPCRAGAQDGGTSFRVGRGRCLQRDGCWMQTQQLRPRHSQEHSRMPPWAQRLLEKRQLSWRKPSGSAFVVLLSCGGLDCVRASLLPSPCRRRGERVSGRVSVWAAVCPSPCVSVWAQTGIGHCLPQSGTGISQGKTTGMFEDLCSVCKEGLEERRSKKKIGAELKSMAGRD